MRHFISCKFWYFNLVFKLCSVQFSSVTQSCPTLCHPMNCSTPGLLVHHQLPEFTQTHVHRVGNAIQPSHPLSPLLLLPPIPPSIRVFSNESTLGMRWPKLKDTRRHAPFLHGGTLYLLDYRCFLPSFKTSLPPLLLQHISEYCIPSLWKLQPPRVLLLLEYKATRPDEKS